jgi:hypothetical protein
MGSPAARATALAALLVLALTPRSPATAQVLPSDPLPSPAVDAPIPVLPLATFVLADAPLSLKSPLVVHEGRFTWGGDLVPLVTNISCPTAASAGCSGIWLDSFSPSLFPHTAAPSLVTHLSAALTGAFEHQESLDPGPLVAAFDLFKTFAKFQAGGGGVTLTGSAATPLLGYKPLRARWLRSQWGSNNPQLFQPEKKYVYPDYFGFSDLRLRGARLYCATRRAHFVQNSGVSSLGEFVGFSVKVAGKHIDFLVAEGSLRIGGPQRFLGPGFEDASQRDGAQAFMVPLLFGTRITPVRGVGLPGFGEVLVPVALVDGDSEVRTPAHKRNVFVGFKVDCSRSFGCGLEPHYVNMHSKEYHTVTHAAALLSASRSVHASKEFTLFYIGPIRIVMNLGLGFGAGEFQAGSDRVLDTATVPGAPPPTRDGELFNLFTGVRYHDGPWSLSRSFEWRVLPDGQTDPFWRSKIQWFLQPHDVRALQDDDHVASSAVKLTLNPAALGGVLGGGVGPVHAELSVTGGLSGNVAYQHVLRDALLAQDPLGSATAMRPISGLTHRPRLTADVTFDGFVGKIYFEIDLGFLGTIDFEKTLFNIGQQPLASYDSDDGLSASDEQYFLRVGTGSRDGKPMTQPDVLSHLPGQGAFDTFLEDVPACLTDETPSLPVAEACDPVEDDGEPPALEMCIYGAGHRELWPSLPSNACDDIGAYTASIGGTPEEQECAATYLEFFCRPTSKWQMFEGDGRARPGLEPRRRPGDEQPAPGDAAAMRGRLRRARIGRPDGERGEPDRGVDRHQGVPGGRDLDP